MTYLQIRNFKQYQSADLVKKSKGRPPWVKLHREFFIDYELRRLKPQTRLLALFLTSFASEFMREFGDDDDMGTFPHDEGEIAARASLSRAVVRQGISDLRAVGFIRDSLAKDSRKIRSSVRADAPSREAEAEAELVKGKGKDPPEDQNGDAFEKELELGKLLAAVATRSRRGSADSVLRQHAMPLPVGAIAKVRESAEAHPDKGVGWVVNALKLEARERGIAA